MIPAARAALEAVGGATLLLTAKRGDEVRCTRQALAQGATTIVVLGGDGTISRVACELVRVKSRVPLAVFGAGTGNDFAKSLGAPIHDYRAMCHLIATRQSRAVDAGRIDDNFFINSGGFGFDAEVVRKTQRPGRWRGKSVYTATAMQQLFQYRGFDARISQEPLEIASLDVVGSDGSAAIALPAQAPFVGESMKAVSSRGSATSARSAMDGRWLTLVFANGSWFGGSYRIAPEASISDGVLDAVFISDASAWRRAMVFSRALRSRHIGQREVVVQRNTRWSIDFAVAPVYQADGELRQAADSSVVVEVVPEALRVVAGAVPSPQLPQY